MRRHLASRLSLEKTCNSEFRQHLEDSPKFTMRYSSFVFALILPFTLAVIMSLLILVNGDMCGAMTLAEAGDDRASLMTKAFANFRSTCRKGGNNLSKGHGK